MPIDKTAFPLNLAWQEPGVTLRQWYAGMALQGMLPTASTNPLCEITAEKARLIAKWAFLCAEAMLEHEKPGSLPPRNLGV